MTTAISVADVAGLVQDEVVYYTSGQAGLMTTTIQDAEFAVMDVFVDFSGLNTIGADNADSILRNLFGVNINASGFEQFVHNDVSAAGSWNPAASIDLPQAGAVPQIDSFVTINGGLGQTALDPGFGVGLPLDVFNEDIGWYLVPPSDLGAADDGLEVWIGRFVVTGDEARSGAYFDISGTVGYDYGAGTGVHYGDFTESLTFIPVPGTLGVLVAGGFLNVRRRRRI